MTKVEKHQELKWGERCSQNEGRENKKDMTGETKIN